MIASIVQALKGEPVIGVGASAGGLHFIPFAYELMAAGC
jgi:hypothetical protein